LNDALCELNKIIAEKYATLRVPQARMTKPQRERFWEHRRLVGADTRGHAFVTERDIKDNVARSAFRLDAPGRAVIAITRHLGRIREVRGGGATRIVVL
ncbi:Spindle and kinetochore-associated protein 1, partial [Cladochytrium tenue]